MPLKDKRILITGGAGFIGSNLAEYLSAENEVLVLDDLSLGSRENLRGLKVKLIERSILEIDAFKTVGKVDVVFHLAAIPGVQESIDRPVKTAEVNFIGTINVLEYMRKNDVPAVVFASSCAVYGGSRNLPLKESEFPEPLSPYAAEKLASEHIIRNYANIHGIYGISARFFNVYGPRQNPSSEYSAVIPKFISRCLGGNPPIIYGNGKQSRDFVYVLDLAKALEMMAEKRPETDAINIGSGREISINQLADIIIRETDCNLRAEHAPERKGEIERSLADITLARKLLGWEPEHSLQDGIRETIEWMKNSNYHG